MMTDNKTNTAKLSLVKYRQKFKKKNIIPNTRIEL